MELVLDVTISWSTPVAEKGLLTLFGGGNKECFDDADRSFALSPKIFYLGRRSGATISLFEHLLGIGNAGDCRSVALGEKAGPDRIASGTFCPRLPWSLQRTWQLHRAMKIDYSRNFRVGLLTRISG